jgi:C4-dicarboxylate transporter, DctM subunit
MVGIGLMVYSYFTFSQTVRERSSLEEVAGAGGASVVPLLIPFIIIAGILGGYFTPTEAGMVAVVYTIVIAMPVIAVLVELGGIDPVHMGVVAIVTLAFGLITPPYGLALLLAATFAEVPFSRALVKALPIYVVFFVVISLLILFPDLVLWLPGLFDLV